MWFGEEEKGANEGGLWGMRRVARGRSGLWALGSGFCALRSSPRVLVSALCALGSGLWVLVSALCALRSALCPLPSGLWALGSGLWALVSGPSPREVIRDHFGGLHGAEGETASK